jgi:Zn finger protein HypA/HybF involved in hydrogenase expression
MTKPEAVTQEAIQAAKDYLRGNGPWKDSEIGITEDDYLVQCFGKAIQAAEQRGKEREREREHRCPNCHVKYRLITDVDEPIAQAICQGEQA